MSINTPEVTVVVPTFNRAEFLNGALSSVFAQVYKNFEIIVVDDGSTDSTALVVRPLVERNLIRYIYQQNQGVSSARNRGVIEARGRYIAFLDSDDLFVPEKLDIQVKYLFDHPEVGLVHSGFTKFDDRGNDLGYRDTSWFFGRIYPQILLYWTTLMAIDTVVIPRRVFEEVGYFDEKLKIGEDLDMWRRISRKYPFGFINQNLAYVRVHTRNTSANPISVVNEFENYLGKAFDDDHDLSIYFRRRVLSKMFSNQAYMLLGGGEETLQVARLNATKAILNNPWNVHGYLSLLATILGYNVRLSIVHLWRRIRSGLMSKNHTG